MSDATDPEIQAWLADCTRLVIEHLRAKGFPVDEYRIDLVLTDREQCEPPTITINNCVAIRSADSGKAEP